MRKFLLADPSIAAEGGHYLEYAHRVLEAAAKLGFQPFLATNKAFDSSRERIETLPVFTHDVWGRELARQSDVISPPTVKDRAYLRWRISRMGRLWAAAGQPEVVSHYLRDVGVGARTLRRLEQAANLRAQVLSLLERLPDEGGPERERTERALRLVLSGKGMSHQHVKAFPRLAQPTTAASEFAVGVAQVIEHFALQDGDHMFLPTMGWHDLAGLQLFLQRSEPKILPHLHLLFRRNVYDGYEDTWDAQEYSVHAFRSLFARVAATRGADRVRIYTDTEALTAQYMRLCAPSLVTVPIPTPAPGARRAPRTQRIRLSYLGDARREKGIERLPELLQSIERSPQSRLSLSIQWYLPSGNTPVDVLSIVERMRRSRSGRLRIVDGYLDGRQYSDEIADSDAILILYDRAQYIARSSGIFVESIIAGKPVLATAGTWMSSVLDSITARYHDLRLKSSTVLKEQRLPCGVWQSTNGESLADHMGPSVHASARGLTADLQVPVGATHLRLAFRDEPEGRARFLRIKCSSLRDDVVLAEDSYLMGGGASREYSLVVPTVEGQRVARLNISSAYSPLPKVIASLQASWLAVEGPVARSAGGVMFDPHEGGQPMTESLIRGAKELERDYDDHVKAAAFARDILSGYHNAEHLIRTLAQSAEFRFPSVDSMSVKGW